MSALAAYSFKSPAALFPHDFGQRVSDDARRRGHRGAGKFGHRLAGRGVDGRCGESVGGLQRIEPARRRGERRIRDRHLAEQAARVTRIADVDRLGRCTEGGEIAAGIDQAARLIVATKNIDGAIDREPLGNAAEINP